jgi:hypothetical protein
MTALHDHPAHPAQPADGVRALHVRAREIRPGDYLPPQRALHGTPFRDEGFVVGSGARDVTQPAVLSGRMLVFGPEGTLDSLLVDADVAVVRPRRPRST